MLNGGRVARLRGEPRETHTGVHARTHTPTYTDMMDHKGQRGDRGNCALSVLHGYFSL